MVIWLVPGDLVLGLGKKWVEVEAVADSGRDVTTGGATKLKFNNATGVTVFVDGKPVDAKAETLLDLKPGTVTLVVDRAKNAPTTCAWNSTTWPVPRPA